MAGTPAISEKDLGEYGTRLTVMRGERVLTASEVTALWAADSAFAQDFSKVLVQRYPAIFFECVPVTTDTFGQRPFECMVINARALARAAPDDRTFAAHFQQVGEGEVVTFDNVGRDATLVAPTPFQNLNYAHLATFLRQAPEATVATFWQRVASAYIGCVQARGVAPTWLSTSGLGVFWLHMRIDVRPKYYTHQAYRTFIPTEHQQPLKDTS